MRYKGTAIFGLSRESLEEKGGDWICRRQDGSLVAVGGNGKFPTSFWVGKEEVTNDEAPAIHYWGFALSSGDEVLNPSVFDTAAERDASLEASGFNDHPHACQGTTATRCETCQTYWHSGRRIGAGCGDCR